MPARARRARLRRADFVRFGYSNFCPGCENLQAGGLQAINHSEQCRQRMEEKLAETEEGLDRVRRAKFRLDQAVVRATGDLSRQENEQLLASRGCLDGGGGGDTLQPEEKAEDEPMKTDRKRQVQWEGEEPARSAPRTEVQGDEHQFSDDAEASMGGNSGNDRIGQDRSETQMGPGNLDVSADDAPMEGADLTENVWSEPVNDVPMQSTDVLVITKVFKDLRRTVEKCRPLLLIGAMDVNEVDRDQALQVNGGRYYLHESGVRGDAVSLALAEKYDDHFTTSTFNEMEDGAAERGARWITNSGCLAEAVHEVQENPTKRPKPGSRYASAFQARVMKALGGICGLTSRWD